jgi:hypothetical protein
VINTPLRGIVTDIESAISSRVSPISSWWSSRTFVMIVMSERTMKSCEYSW